MAYPKPSMSQVSSPNYGLPRGTLGRNGNKVIAIVEHIMCGTLVGTDSWFQNSASQVSSHFGVGKNGEIHQYVDINNVAWGNGVVDQPSWPLLTLNVNPNYYTVSIEHEGQSGDQLTEAQYQATLALHHWLIDIFELPVNENTILGHYRIDSVNRAGCPGSGFPWTRLLNDLEGGNNMLNVAVLLFTKEDYWAGTDVAVKNGNCALFVRPADSSVPAEAMTATQLIVVGGPTTHHPNEILLSGKDKYATAAAVAKYLGI